MKTCTKCGLEKSMEEFYKNKNKSDGRHCWCKSCCKKYSFKYTEMEKPAIASKVCSKCKIEKSAEEFADRKLSKDGKMTWCQSCMKEYRSQRALMSIKKIVSKQCGRCGLEQQLQRFLITLGLRTGCTLSVRLVPVQRVNDTVKKT